MNTLKAYINEVLFTNSIEKEIDNNIDIYNIKKELINIFKNIKKSDIQVIDNKISINNAIILQEKEIRKIKKLLKNKYHIKYCKKCMIYLNIRINFPEFLNETEFDELIINNSSLQPLILQNINIKINKFIIIDDRFYKYKNINIYTLNKINLSIKLSNCFDQEMNKDILNNLNIDKNHINNFYIRYFDPEHCVIGSHAPKEEILKTINEKIYPWLKDITLLKNHKKIFFIISDIYTYEYDIENKIIK